MKNKLILILLSTLLTVSMIGCGSKEKKNETSTDSRVTVSADEDVEINKNYGKDICLESENYLTAFNGDINSKGESSLIGKVTADKGNLSKIEDFEKNPDGRTLICYLDTTGFTDLKVGDVVSIGIIDNDDESDKDKEEFRYKAEPMSMNEYKKTVSERTGDTRDKLTKDENVYLKDEKGNLIFAPELSMASEEIVSLLPTRVLNSQSLRNIKGSYDGEVVLIDIKNGDRMLVATKVNDKFEYFFVSIRDLKKYGISDRNYKIGDKVKVTIGICPESTEPGTAIE